jgi:hypothetical protein
VLAPHAGWRARVAGYGAPPVESPVVASESAERDAEPPAAPTPRHWAWADLMRRAFEIDVLACPRCGGRLRLIATIEDPDAISRDPGRARRVARDGGAGAAPRARADPQARGGDRCLS